MSILDPPLAAPTTTGLSLTGDMANTTSPPPASTVPGKRSRAAMLQLSEEQAEQLAQQDPTNTLSLSERLLIESAAEKDRVSEMRIMPQEVVRTNSDC